MANLSVGGQAVHLAEEEVQEAQAASSQLQLHRVAAAVGALRLQRLAAACALCPDGAPGLALISSSPHGPSDYPDVGTGPSAACCPA